MIFETWRSYFISWQMFKNKVWCPISRKIRRYFHFLLSLAYPIDRLDWSLFSVVILFHHWLIPLLEKIEIRAYILPHNFPAVLIIFAGQEGAIPGPNQERKLLCWWHWRDDYWHWVNHWGHPLERKEKDEKKYRLDLQGYNGIHIYTVHKYTNSFVHDGKCHLRILTDSLWKYC